MRLAVLIISLFLVVIIGLQSCTVMVGGNIGSNHDLSEGGAVGILIAILYILGAAFIIGLPRISMIIFIIAAVLGFTVGSTTPFTDMKIWGGVAVVLAILSFFGSRELRKKQLTAAP